MKVIVTSVFRDKFTHRLYNRGDSFDIKDEARVQDLESRKLAERVEVPEEKKEPKSAAKPAKKTAPRQKKPGGGK